MRCATEKPDCQTLTMPFSATDTQRPTRDDDRAAPQEAAPCVRLQGLLARDRPLHTAHLLRLTREDRRARFNASMSDKAIAAYSRDLDWSRAWIFGAFVEGVLRGVGELVPNAAGDQAELAISVERPFQHMGIGKMLSLALVLVARRTGIGTIRILYVPGNDSMRALVRALGARTHSDDGMIEGVFTVPPKPDDAPATAG